MLFVNHQDVLSITPYFIVVNDAFTKEECKQIIEIGQKTDIQKSKILSEDVNPNANMGIRQSKSSFVYPNQETSWIFSRLFEVTTFANENYFQFDIKGFGSFQYTEYHQGGDHYDWHLDLALKGPEENNPTYGARFRKLSGSLILSDPDEYTGGQLYIERRHDNTPMSVVSQGIGSIVFFPSFVAHKVDKVYSGTRRSLVFWVEGPKFK